MRPLASSGPILLPPSTLVKPIRGMSEVSSLTLDETSVRAPLAPRDPPRFALTTTKRSPQPAYALHHRTLVPAPGCCRSCPPSPTIGPFGLSGVQGAIHPFFY